MRDPFVLAVGGGLVAALGGGPAIESGLSLVRAEYRRQGEWLAIVGLALLAIAAAALSRGPIGVWVFAFLAAALPGVLAYLAWRTVFASAVVACLPLYFVIGAGTPGGPLHVPATFLDALIPLSPAWTLVYGSLYAMALLPLFVIREGPLFRRVMQALLAVMWLAYAGFLLYPTVTPRPPMLTGRGFGTWALGIVYSLDTRYNCFPCLHVAYSVVAALGCYRVNARVGIVATAWTALIAISTLYTKQHYVLDVVAGALMGYGAYVI
ncbi:MAG TPA: phosphatase PAP2 family protein, partial [Vicinamibacterales bacterium]|nr:phosphatase PAP2 family protein [Vicinamibacterales bacterium]